MENKKRTKILKVRLNEAEHSRIKNFAEDRKLAIFAREKLLDSHVSSYPKKINAAKADPAVVRKIALAGNNLNQIARSLNRCVKNAHEIDFLFVSAQLNAIWGALNDLQDI